MSKTRLHYTETAHRAARWIIGANCVSVHGRVITLIRPLCVGDSVNENCWRCAGVRTTIENETSVDLYDFAVCISVVTHENGGWMPMHMAEETFLAAVLHFDGATGF